MAHARSTIQFHIWVLILAGGFILYFNNTENEYKERKYLFVPPSIHIKKFTLGYNETMADVFWLRLMQDFGYCDQDRTSLGSPLSPSGAKRGKNRVPECSYGWGYHMLNLITELAPRFKLASVTGPMSLSVLADDIDGATALFEKALKLYPNDWNLRYQAGYHFMLELEDKERAIKEYSIAAQSPDSPDWLPLLIARLYKDTGQSEVAMGVLQNFLKDVKGNDRLYERALKKISDIKAEDNR